MSYLWDTALRHHERNALVLPLHAIPKVAPGDKVLAITTILTTLNKA